MKAGGIEGEGDALAFLEQVLSVVHLAVDEVFGELKVVVLLENPADVLSAIIEMLRDFRHRTNSFSCRLDYLLVQLNNLFRNSLLSFQNGCLQLSFCQSLQTMSFLNLRNFFSRIYMA